MKMILLLVGLALVSQTGCSSDPRPAPGMSGMVIKVMAAPKTGAPEIGASGYDQTPILGFGDRTLIDYANLQDIVVWAEPLNPASPIAPAAAPVTIDLTGKKASSDLTAVASVGQLIVFHNASQGPLNSYCVSDGNNFNLGTIAPGGQAQIVARSAGLIEILADSIPNPIARIYVVPTPWVSLTQSGATVVFSSLPPGQYRIVSWHPRLPGTSTEVNLLPDQVAHSSIDVSVNHLPKIGSR